MKILELTIPYSETKIRTTIKKYYNGKWNADSKTWTVEIKEKDEEVFFVNFSDYITKEDKIEVSTKETAKKWIPANHATPGHYAYESGNYGQDVLSGFYQE